ncbi:MAG TPA: S9 family peptidase [Actinomycetota bacterium]|nr:S9 family peptidase [Actinomycetota bacterium]
MKPEHVYDLTGATDPRLSPDGRTVACTVWRVDRDANAYRGAIWLTATDGSEPPRRLTSGEHRDGSPRWSPDGTMLAFVRTRGDVKDAEAQLCVLPLAGGEPRTLTDLKESVEDPSWSPDGSTLLFVARTHDPDDDERDERRRAPRRITRLQFKLDSVGWTAGRRQHLYTVPADGSAPATRITDGDFEDADPCWSPDGTQIAFCSARDEDWDTTMARDLFVMPANGGEPRKLTASDGAASSPSWSPDGRRIACLWYPVVFDDPRHTQVAVFDAASGERTVLTDSLDRNCGIYPTLREPIWDGEDLIFATEDSGNNPVYRVRADGSGKPEPILEGDFMLTGLDAAAGVVVHAATTAVTPSEIFNGATRLTSVGDALVAAIRPQTPERFTAISADGSEVEAWIIPPANAEPGARYPTLLNIHGGPFSQYGNKLFDEFQVQAGAGYAVVYANPRGSSGYSEAWGRAIRPADGSGWGGVDFQDLMAVMDEAERRFNFVDPSRTGVLGGSYGGYMTSWIVAHTDRFKAACSERAVNNFVMEGGSADLGWMFQGEFGTTWYEDPHAYLKMSPSMYASSITTPLLILHSESDLRCPVGHAEDLFTILRLRGRPVEMVRFPAESHELSRAGSPVHRVQRFEIILEWFDRHLKDPA